MWAEPVCGSYAMRAKDDGVEAQTKSRMSRIGDWVVEWVVGGEEIWGAGRPAVTMADSDEEDVFAEDCDGFGADLSRDVQQGRILEVVDEVFVFPVCRVGHGVVVDEEA